MKYFIFIICLLFVACAAPHYQSLPQGVSVSDLKLSGATDAAIQGINNALGEVFYRSDEAITSVECATQGQLETDHQGRCEMNWGQDGLITQAKVLVDCNIDWPEAALSHLIAHELYHCLGFLDHSVSPGCLNTEPIPWDDDIETLICPEMIEAFQEIYIK